MLATTDTLAIVALAVVAMALLLGVAAFVGTYLGRQLIQKAIDQSNSNRQSKERLEGQLQDCVQLGDSVERDLEVVSSLLTDETAGVPPELMNAMRQLVKNTKALSGKLQRSDDSSSSNRTSSGGAPAPASGKFTLTPPESPKSSEKPAVPAPAAAPELKVDDEDGEEDEGAESRRFPRSPCHGSLQATIYPPPSNPTGEPVRCAVLTRNLSCGGVGIAHSEKLFPKQVLVLEAVGRLLVAEVRWCRQLDDKFFIVGCRLIKTAE